MNNNKKMNATSNSIKDEYYDQAYENNETIEGPVMSMRKRY